MMMNADINSYSFELFQQVYNISEEPTDTIAKFLQVSEQQTSFSPSLFFSQLMELYERKANFSPHVKSQIPHIFFCFIDQLPTHFHKAVLLRSIFAINCWQFQSFCEKFFETLNNVLTNIETNDNTNNNNENIYEVFQELMKLFVRIAAAAQNIPFDFLLAKSVQIVQNLPQYYELCFQLKELYRVLKGKIEISSSSEMELFECIFNIIKQSNQANNNFKSLLEIFYFMDIPLPMELFDFINALTSQAPAPGQSFSDCYIAINGSVRGICAHLYVSLMKKAAKYLDAVFFEEINSKLFSANNFFLLGKSIEFLDSSFSMQIEVSFAHFLQQNQMPANDNIPDFLYLFCRFIESGKAPISSVPPVILQCIDEIKKNCLVHNDFFVVYATILVKAMYVIIKKFTLFFEFDWVLIVKELYNKIETEDGLSFFTLLLNQGKLNQQGIECVLQIASELPGHIDSLINSNNPKKLRASYDFLNTVFESFGKSGQIIDSSIYANTWLHILCCFDTIYPDHANSILNLIVTFYSFPNLRSEIPNNYNETFLEHFLTKFYADKSEVPTLVNQFISYVYQNKKQVLPLLIIFMKIASYDENMESIFCFDEVIQCTLKILQIEQNDQSLAQLVLLIFMEYLKEESDEVFSYQKEFADLSLLFITVLSRPNLANLPQNRQDKAFIQKLLMLSIRLMDSCEIPEYRVAGEAMFCSCLKQYFFRNFPFFENDFNKQSFASFLHALCDPDANPLTFSGGTNSPECIVIFNALGQIANQLPEIAEQINLDYILDTVNQNYQAGYDSEYISQRLKLSF